MISAVERLVLILSLVLGCFRVASASESRDDQLLVVQNGTSNYDIVIEEDAPQGVREAAIELQRVVRVATQVQIPVVTALSATRHHIIVGGGKHASDSGISLDGLSPDGFQVRVHGQDIYLVGSDDSAQDLYYLNNNKSASAGTYNAVIEVASRFLGARWYMPGQYGEEIPSAVEFAVPRRLDIEGAPRFPIRYIDVTLYRGVGRERSLIKQGDISGSYFDETAAQSAVRWGRHLRLGQNFQLELGQSWYLWMPADAPTAFSSRYYGKARPEFYSVPYGRQGAYYYGSDHAHGGQLCIVNPDVAAELARNMVNYALRTGIRSFSVSPNDGGWDCDSRCCGSRFPATDAGRAALRDQLTIFVNDVAGKVSKEFPSARFGLLAYDWTLEPPTGQRTAPNIDISDVYNGFPFRYHKPAERQEMERLIRRWRKQAGSVVLTTYSTYEGFYSLPWSTVDEQAWLVGLLAEFPASRGLRMNYAQLDTPPIGALGPDPWVLAQLLWNPAQSVETLKADFYEGAFGNQAGPLLRAYFEEIARSMALTVDRYPFTDNSASHVAAYVLPAYSAVRTACRRLIDRAVSAVAIGPERYRWRVDRVARGWRLAELTIDAMEAERTGDRSNSQRLWSARRELLADPESRFALAPASTELMDRWVPLGKSR